MTRTWILKERPTRELRTDLLELQDRPDPALGAGEVRVRNLWASVDPYMRGLIDGQGGYVPPIALGEAMHGGAIGEVIESRADSLPVGTHVVHNAGWRDVATIAAASASIVDADDAIPLQHYLGAFGMPGMTAYFGLLHTGQAKRGETLFVSSAAGAVGSVVVQIAKATGMRVIASAGGAEKCDAVRALGADATIDYKAGDLSARLAEAAPEGIDVTFDNVGGDHLAAAIDNARQNMRVTLCGMISGYANASEMVIPQPMRLIAKRIRLLGHYAPDHYAHRGQFLDDMRRWYAAGELSCPTRVFDGLDTMPQALLSLYEGASVGKVLVRLA